MIPTQTKDIVLYYSAFLLLAFVIIFRRRPKRTLRLKMGGGGRVSDRARPLNVVFNYNGETWDAFEVLGLPAGSSIEAAQKAFDEAAAKIDPKSRVFLEAALSAIRTQNQVLRASGASR